MKQINEVIPIYKKENKCYFILIEDMERLNKLVSPSYYKFINHLEYIPVFGLNLCKININSDRIPEGLIKILPISGLTPTIRESLSKCIKEYLGNCKFVDITLIDSDFTESVLSSFIEQVHKNKLSRYEENALEDVSYVFIEDYGLKLTIYNNEFRFKLEVIDLNTFTNKLGLYIDKNDNSVFRFVSAISILFKQPISSKLKDFDKQYKTRWIW